MISFWQILKRILTYFFIVFSHRIIEGLLVSNNIVIWQMIMHDKFEWVKLCKFILFANNFISFHHRPIKFFFNFNVFSHIVIYLLIVSFIKYISVQNITGLFVGQLWNWRELLCAWVLLLFYGRLLLSENIVDFDLSPNKVRLVNLLSECPPCRPPF